MKLVLSRCYPVIDEQTLTEYFARNALFRTDDGSFLLCMASEGQAEREERILFLDCRDALVWLNATPDAVGAYWHSPKPSIRVIYRKKLPRLLEGKRT